VDGYCSFLRLGNDSAFNYNHMLLSLLFYVYSCTCRVVEFELLRTNKENIFCHRHSIQSLIYDKKLNSLRFVHAFRVFVGCEYIYSYNKNGLSCLC
jgi:hypothetical protein